MIKFRGRTVWEDKLIYGDLIHHSGEFLIVSKAGVPAETVSKPTVAQLVAYDKLGNELYTDDVVINTDGTEIKVADYYIETGQIGTYVWECVVLKNGIVKFMEQHDFQQSDNSTGLFILKEPYLVDCIVDGKDYDYQFKHCIPKSAITITSDKFSKLTDSKKFECNLKKFIKNITAIQDAL